MNRPTRKQSMRSRHLTPVRCSNHNYYVICECGEEVTDKAYWAHQICYKHKTQLALKEGKEPPKLPWHT